MAYTSLLVQDNVITQNLMKKATVEYITTKQIMNKFQPDINSLGREHVWALQTDNILNRFSWKSTQRAITLCSYVAYDLG